MPDSLLELIRDKPRRWRWVVPIALFLAFCGCRRTGGSTADAPEIASSDAGRPERGLAGQSLENDSIVAQQSFRERDFDSAKSAAQKALLKSPNDVGTLKLLAQIHAATNDYATAADVHRQLASQEIPGRLNLLLQAFDWNARAGRFDEAEKDMLRAIEGGIDDSRAAQVLCQLYSSQGRRHEACRQALQLARMGALKSEELYSLLDRSGPFQLVSFAELIPRDRITLFDLGEARILDTLEQDHDAALAKVQAVSSSVPNHPAVEAMRGKLLALRTGNREALEKWHRSFAEAIRRDPTDRVAMREIKSALIRLGEDSKAQSIHQTIAVLDQIYRRSDRNTRTVERAHWIASRMQEMS